jgi:hypothetical protein
LKEYERQGDNDNKFVDGFIDNKGGYNQVGQDKDKQKLVPVFIIKQINSGHFKDVFGVVGKDNVYKIHPVRILTG